jgi:hypothetical protein
MGHKVKREVSSAEHAARIEGAVYGAQSFGASGVLIPHDTAQAAIAALRSNNNEKESS